MLSLLFFAFISWANPDGNPQSGFLTGVKELQSGQFEQAEANFKQEYASGRESPSLFLNWGLAAYEQGKRGLAVGLWRRALFISPDYSAADQALEFAASQMPADVFRSATGGWEWLRARVLGHFDLHKLIFLQALLLLVSGFLVIRYLGARKRALQQVTPLPAFPSVGVLVAILFAASVTLSALKAYSLTEVRATVVSSTVSLRTGPNDADNTLIDLIEGLEVIVRNQSDKWVQVRFPGGPIGWVPQDSLFQHTGYKRLW